MKTWEMRIAQQVLAQYDNMKFLCHKSIEGLFEEGEVYELVGEDSEMYEIKGGYPFTKELDWDGKSYKDWFTIIDNVPSELEGAVKLI